MSVIVHVVGIMLAIFQFGTHTNYSN